MSSYRHGHGGIAQFDGAFGLILSVIFLGPIALLALSIRNAFARPTSGGSSKRP